ncbi:MAG: hypothetical protein KatS3mg044_1483 [Rhodothermaceae bacterium]|nr:MAG: hypothetical protein KatS3mg044_1483 [Rhodothermaceae bacterium]
MTALPAPAPHPSAYEADAFRAIQAWRRPGNGWLDRMAAGVQATWQEVTEQVRRVPGLAWTIDNLVAGLLQVLNEITQDTVWTEPVYRAYREAGHDVRCAADVLRLDLSVVDARLEGLAGRYRALAAAEGTATGLAGASGILPDLVALVALNLRAVGEHAAWCGFDLARPAERLYALTVLDQVARTRDKATDVALTPVTVLAGRSVRRQGLRAAEQLGLAEAIERVIRSLGLRLTGAKLGQVVPVAGALLGGGFNLLYTDRVCRAAYHLYRERFLFAKYGPDLTARLAS